MKKVISFLLAAVLMVGLSATTPVLAAEVKLTASLGGTLRMDNATPYLANTYGTAEVRTNGGDAPADFVMALQFKGIDTSKEIEEATLTLITERRKAGEDVDDKMKITVIDYTFNETTMYDEIKDKISASKATKGVEFEPQGIRGIACFDRDELETSFAEWTNTIDVTSLITGKDSTINLIVSAVNQDSTAQTCFFGAYPNNVALDANKWGKITKRFGISKADELIPTLTIVYKDAASSTTEEKVDNEKVTEKNEDVKATDTSNTEALPKTGATSTYLVYGVGALVFLALIFILKKKELKIN